MQKTYTHLLEKVLCNQALALHSAKLEEITSKVTLRLMTGQALDSGVSPTPHTEVSSETIPVIKVFDSLVAKGGWVEDSSGLTSYSSISNQLRDLVAKGNKDIVLHIDSPGGEVAGLFALTSYMSSLKEQGINLIGVTDGLCASAAYAIGSACGKLYATQGSEVGSIGVVAALVDVTKMDAERGIQYTIVRSKEEKALGNPHEPVTDEIVAKLQDKLTQYDALFNAEVNKNRPNVSIESIIRMKGNTFLSEEALSLHLIDGLISSVPEFINSLASNKSSQQPNTRGITMSEMTMESVLAKNVELSTALANANASLASAEQRGKQEEQQRILGILKAGATFGIGANSIEKVILAGFTSEQATMNFEMAKEAAQAMQTPNTVTPQQAGTVAGLASKASADIQGKTVWSKEFL